MALRPLSAAPHESDAIADVRQRLDAVTRERDQLLIVVDLLQELSASANVLEVLQRIARRLDEIVGLDRSSVYLAGQGQDKVRLAATFEDPTLRNLVVDLSRYPELREAFASGQTVFIPDAMNDPMLAEVRHTLDDRRVSSIVVVPIRWRQTVIGAVFLRTELGGVPFSARDILFCEVIAGLAGRALRNAHQAAVRDKQSDERELSAPGPIGSALPWWPSCVASWHATPHPKTCCGPRHCSCGNRTRSSSG